MTPDGIALFIGMVSLLAIPLLLGWIVKTAMRPGK